MFVVVRNTKSASNNLDYKLKKGDIIKLGRIKFNVKDFKSHFGRPNQGIEEEEDDHKNCLERSYDSTNQEFEEEAVEIDCGVVDTASCKDIQCKVCWDKDSTEENPLLNSCQCDGSVRYIHYNCLKYWLK